VDEDCLLELAQRWARLQSQLVSKQPPRQSERVECVALPSRTVERARELCTEPLVEWMLLDQRLDLADELRVTAQRKLRVDEILERDQPVEGERRQLDLREELELSSFERPPAPELECCTQLLGALDVVACCAGVRRKPLELAHVGPFLRGAEHVPRGLSDDRRAAEQAAESRDVVLERRRRRRWCALSPQCVNQPVGRDDLACVEREKGEQGPLLRSPQRHRLVADDRLDWSEDA
jgi:hypothetical protein